MPDLLFLVSYPVTEKLSYCLREVGDHYLFESLENGDLKALFKDKKENFSVYWEGDYTELSDDQRHWLIFTTIGVFLKKLSTE